jgi:hypothetical protein
MNLPQSAQLTIRAWYATNDINRLSKQLRLPVETIHAEAERLGLPRSGKYRSQTQMAEAARCRAVLKAAKMPSREIDERDKRLLAEYPNTPNALLAKNHGLTVRRIQNIAAKYGVKKAEGYISAINVRPPRRPVRQLVKKPTIRALRQTIDALKQGDNLTALHILEQFFAEAA